jgi:hypothetical protein
VQNNVGLEELEIQENLNILTLTDWIDESLNRLYFSHLNRGGDHTPIENLFHMQFKIFP